MAKPNLNYRAICEKFLASRYKKAHLVDLPKGRTVHSIYNSFYTTIAHQGTWPIRIRKEGDELYLIRTDV